MPRRSAPVDLANIESQLRSIERGEGEGDLEIDADTTLRVSSLAKIFFPKAGITKGALMRYYVRIWPVLQPHVQDRALS